MIQIKNRLADLENGFRVTRREGWAGRQIGICYWHVHPSIFKIGNQQSGLPWWHSWWRIHLQCRRPLLDPCIGNIPWRSELPTPVVLLAEYHEQRSLVGCSPWGSQRVGHNWVTKHIHTHRDIYTHTHTHTNKYLLYSRRNPAQYSVITYMVKDHVGGFHFLHTLSSI